MPRTSAQSCSSKSGLLGPGNEERKNAQQVKPGPEDKIYVKTDSGSSHNVCSRCSLFSLLVHDTCL
jgi:hypothetical protein